MSFRILSCFFLCIQTQWRFKVVEVPVACRWSFGLASAESSQHGIKSHLSDFLEENLCSTGQHVGSCLRLNDIPKGHDIFLCNWERHFVRVECSRCRHIDIVCML